MNKELKVQYKHCWFIYLLIICINFFFLDNQWRNAKLENKLTRTHQKIDMLITINKAFAQELDYLKQQIEELERQLHFLHLFHHSLRLFRHNNCKKGTLHFRFPNIFGEEINKELKVQYKHCRFIYLLIICINFFFFR